MTRFRILPAVIVVAAMLIHYHTSRTPAQEPTSTISPSAGFLKPAAEARTD